MEERVFSRDFIIRIFLISIVCLGILVSVWSYNMSSNVIIELNESNKEQFNSKFAELSNLNISDIQRIDSFRQRKVDLIDIDRGSYGMSSRAFSNLPFVPEDFSKMKYLYDDGRFNVLGDLTEEYYLQPELYNSWFTNGINYHKRPEISCSSGFFVSPGVQQIYTRAGSVINTYSFVSSDFCVTSKQYFKLISFYPSEGETQDGIKFRQDSSKVAEYISISLDSEDVLLGRSYPVFDKDWSSKIKVSIRTAKNTPSGIYVIGIKADKSMPWFTKMSNVNYDSYLSKKDSILATYIIAVE